jgi:hypothetical protein
MVVVVEEAGKHVDGGPLEPLIRLLLGHSLVPKKMKARSTHEVNTHVHQKGKGMCAEKGSCTW